MYRKLKVIILFWFLIFNVRYNLQAQIAVSGGTLAAGNYVSLKSAIDSVNAKSVTGNVFININAGYVEILSAKIVLIASGNAAAIITIQKSGVGANPKLISYVGVSSVPSSTADGFFILSGISYLYHLY